MQFWERHNQRTIWLICVVLGVAALAAVSLNAWGQAGNANGAEYVALVENLENHPNERVRVSGAVSWVENDMEFTLADSTGDIEVNLALPRPGLDVGDYVTVSGMMDPTLIDEIDSASVTVIAEDYDVWSTTYVDLYDTPYDLGGIDAMFVETVDYDDPLYDDTLIILSE